jgi:hypothetical protein
MARSEHVSVVLYYKSFNDSMFEACGKAVSHIGGLIDRRRQGQIDLLIRNGENERTRANCTEAASLISTLRTTRARGAQLWVDSPAADRDIAPLLIADVTESSFRGVDGKAQPKCCMSMSNRYLRAMNAASIAELLREVVVPLSEAGEMTSGVIDVSNRGDTASGMLYSLEGSVASAPWHKRLVEGNWISAPFTERCNMVRQVCWGTICGPGIAARVPLDQARAIVEEHRGSVADELCPSITPLSNGGYIILLSGHPRTMTSAYRNGSASDVEFVLASQLHTLFRSRGALC